ncbi:MAG: hypothetical protein A2Z34_05840 [Planctomycetes bacterium RBG_16_59_8]|nr:MAG: hypothetical protein A2Z34_05840 [Planctomycetes bacterium RBG_16_59_8]
MKRGGVFLTDGYWPKTLAAVRSLGEAGMRVVVGSDTWFSPALYSRHAHRRLRYPSFRRDPEGFLKSLQQAIRRHGCDVLLPMEESTLLFVLRHRSEFESFCRIPFASAEVVERAGNKREMLDLASRIGIPVPRSVVVRKAGDLPAAAQAIGFPAVLKPTIGSGAYGLRYVADLEGLRASYEDVRRRCSEFLLQERLPQHGQAIGVSLLLDENGRLLARFTHRRLREYPITGGASTLRESIRFPLLEERALALLRALHWGGVAMVEFKQDVRDGEYKLMEVNPRFWGSLALAIRSGVNFPFLLANRALGKEQSPVVDYRVGVRSRWLPGDLLHHAARLFGGEAPPPTEGRRAHEEIVAGGDPVPALVQAASLVPLFANREYRHYLRR